MAAYRPTLSTIPETPENEKKSILDMDMEDLNVDYCMARHIGQEYLWLQELNNNSDSDYEPLTIILELGPCVNCQNPSLFACCKCKASYCSRICRKINFSEHSSICKVDTIRNPEKDRHNDRIFIDFMLNAIKNMTVNNVYKSGYRGSNKSACSLSNIPSRIETKTKSGYRGSNKSACSLSNIPSRIETETKALRKELNIPQHRQ